MTTKKRKGSDRNDRTPGEEESESCARVPLVPHDQFPLPVGLLAQCKCIVGYFGTAKCEPFRKSAHDVQDAYSVDDATNTPNELRWSGGPAVTGRGMPMCASALQDIAAHGHSALGDCHISLSLNPRSTAPVPNRNTRREKRQEYENNLYRQASVLLEYLMQDPIKKLSSREPRPPYDSRSHRLDHAAIKLDSCRDFVAVKPWSQL
ncbi:hypothetical protein CONLIGDRAFT_707131 [Coniochaeta ligniaria NRRL 30616]|uniref:Uncharacterized protein n=1 Tax=Coniochaeta ligniaria NRRL 30616 TaxID=1408157 RepID=A0A1J7IG80_9PEZI|nr:hypothetical protein CONLIGDRAFT_707131 [Coniochaeta ligniaria NRRL 30616]